MNNQIRIPTTSTENFRKTSGYKITSTFRASFFVRICPLWNALPLDIRMSNSVSIFKRKLKALLFKRRNSVFDVDNIRSWRIVCPICRRCNIDSVCTC